MKFEFTEQDNVIRVTPMPDWDNFISFAHQYIEANQGEIIDIASGMDRHQVRYEQQCKQWVLYFEHYSGAIWKEMW